MKVPTSGTDVFAPVAQLGDLFVTTNFPVDSMWSAWRNLAGYASNFADRLRGGGNYLDSRSSAAEDVNATQYLKFDYNNGVDDNLTNPAYQRAYWNFRRAPGFFDEVCYTGDGGSPQVITHNLTVVPEMIIVKARSIGYQWIAYHSGLGTGSYIQLDSTAASVAYAAFPAVSTTTFSANSTYNRASGETYVAYLFATCAGVSKVGSYTGTGTTLQIDCGFTAGARFVLIKKTSGTGSWYVWDSSRGIVAGNDPYLLLNSTAAEVTSTDYVDTASVGFEISSTAPSEINENGGSFIFLAIA